MQENKCYSCCKIRLGKLLLFNEIKYIDRLPTKLQKKEWVCKECEYNHFIICYMCSSLFIEQFVTTGWEDSNCTIEVTMCLKCEHTESCTQCGYLGGSSPCKDCRF